VVLVLLLGGGGTGAWYYYRAAAAAAAVAGAVGTGATSVVCQQALVCCKQVMAVQAKDPTKVAMCDGLTKLPEKMCTEWAEKYRTTAKTLGLACQ
jgi:hypothetical protein